MTRERRKFFLVWSLRLLIGVALGFGVRVLYERHAGFRFASGLAVRSVTKPAPTLADGETAPPAPTWRNGWPVRFSLDEIAQAEDPAHALRAWREAFADAPQDIREACLSAPAEVSLGALRKFVVLLASNAALREELSEFVTMLGDKLATVTTGDSLPRIFTELARMDAGLALDGAQTLDDDSVTAAVWTVIAEEDPRRVIALGENGGVPALALDAAYASLAARSPEEAASLVEGLPPERQRSARMAMAAALAVGDPAAALAYGLDDQGRPTSEWVRYLALFAPPNQGVALLLAVEREHPEMLASYADHLLQLAGREARRDPEAVLGWMQRCIDPTSRMASWTREVFAAAAFQRPELAAETLQAWPDSPARKEAVDRLTSTWIGHDPLAALDWMHRQPSFSWRTSSNILTAAPPEHLPEIARWLQDHGRAEEVGSGLRFLTDRWAQVDPQATFDWARSLPDSPERTSALAGMLGSMSRFSSLDSALRQEIFQEVRAHPETFLESGDPRILLARSDNAAELTGVLLDNLPMLAASATAGGPQAALQSHLAAVIQRPETRDTALAALGALPDASLKQNVYQRVLANTRVDWDLARRLVAEMPDPAAANESMEHIVRRMFR